ncbi:MAG: hypothetical protein AAFV93_22365 [Chloroflexota bacterium]
MSDQQAPRRESGAIIHRRETNWQIYFPFILGILVLVSVFALLGLPTESVWRDRVQAMGDFLYTLLCMIPMLICMLPFYLVILISIYGMTKLHDGTERPLRKLENATESLASRIETITVFINEKTAQFGNTTDPFTNMLTTFDSPAEQNKEQIDNE